MEMYLSRQANGLYMLTEFEPLRKKVGQTDKEDFYVPPGDSIGIRNLCNIALWILKADKLKRMETVKVDLTGHLI